MTTLANEPTATPTTPATTSNAHRGTLTVAVVVPAAQVHHKASVTERGGRPEFATAWGAR